MADILTSNLLTPSFLTESVNQTIMNQDAFIGQSYVPIQLTQSSEYKIRVNKKQSVPVKDIKGSSTSPIRDIQGQDLIKYQPVTFREKIVYTTDDSEYVQILSYLEGYRMAMESSNTTELARIQMRGEELAQGIVEEASLALAGGIEKTIWGALSGSITFASHGILSYNFAGARTPTASVAWSNAATATPIENFKAWKRLFKNSGYKPAEIAMNQATYDEMVATSEVKAFVSGTDSGVLLMTSGQITQVLGLPIRIYDESYLNASGTYTDFIPDGTVYIIGKANFGAPELGRFYMGPTGTNNLNPGAYVNRVDLVTNDPQSIEFRFGFKGLPALFFDNGDGIVKASV